MWPYGEGAEANDVDEHDHEGHRMKKEVRLALHMQYHVHQRPLGYHATTGEVLIRIPHVHHTLMVGVDFPHVLDLRQAPAINPFGPEMDMISGHNPVGLHYN